MGPPLTWWRGRAGAEVGPPLTYGRRSPHPCTAVWPSVSFLSSEAVGTSLSQQRPPDRDTVMASLKIAVWLGFL